MRKISVKVFRFSEKSLTVVIMEKVVIKCVEKLSKLNSARQIQL